MCYFSNQFFGSKAFDCTYFLALKKISYLSCELYFILPFYYSFNKFSYKLIAWHVCRTAMAAMQHMNSQDPMDGSRYYITICMVSMLPRLFISPIITHVDEHLEMGMDNETIQFGP